MSKTERQQYKIAGPATWELIRAAYLGGESARALAERFGVGEHAIRKRITVEKWSKRAYAAALEARGVIREQPKPNYIEEGVLREELRMAAEAREAAEREAEMTSLVDRIAAEEEAADIAAALERRALAQASAAMVQGRSKEAAALASMAEMMRKRAAAAPMTPAPVVAAPVAAPPVGAEASSAELEKRAMAQADAALSEGRANDAKIYMALAEHMRKRAEDESAAEAEEQEAFYAKQSEADEMACFIFTKAAYIANAMVHAPSVAPAAFQGLIKLWREHNLGEGEEDAERAAAKLAASQAAYLDGRYEDNLPDYVRERFAESWAQRRAELEGEPPVPQHWAEDEAELRKNGLWTRED